MTRSRSLLALSLCTLLPFADAPAHGVLGGRVYFGATEQPLACIGVALAGASDSLFFFFFFFFFFLSRAPARADGTFEPDGAAAPGL
ncbi:MAG: hypothetical protein IPJ78_19405 [Gemmatimonadetes bacterium]|nr:hypothetical protein [Gemmatimonadota bacterium]